MVLSDIGVTKGWQRNQMPAYGDAVTVKFWYWSISILGVHMGDLADTVCGHQKAAVLGRDTGKALFLVTLPQCLPRWFPAVKKNPIAWKVRIFFLTSPMHVHCFSVRSSSSFGNEVVDERFGARGGKKKFLNCSNLSSVGDWCVSFICQETDGVGNTPELAPDFTLLVCKISITALHT